MSTSVAKSKVTKTWAPEKLQQQVSNAVVGQMVSAVRLLGSSPDLLRQLRIEWAKLKVEQFKTEGVKTPLDLARVWTEYETNMFGSKVHYWGDEKQAHVGYEECSCWSALERMKPSDSDKESMCSGWEEMTQILAREFGFSGKEVLGSRPDEPACTITFTVL